MYLSVKLLALVCSHMVSASQWLTKSHTKKCSEFENNAVSHMTIVGQLTCWLGTPYMYNWHYLCIFDIRFIK